MRPPTDSQWEAVRAIGEHVLVTAGAGTGKTSTVVARMLYLLGVEIRGARCATPLRLRDIAAITYTNAAAADLKRKLREELHSAGLRDAAYEVDAARIGTIHGFCGDILREFALRAGRHPGFRILDEAEGEALIAEVVHETVLRALEERSVAGLDELLAAWSLRDVEEWLRRLVGESGRLDRIAERRDALGALERTVLALALAARQETVRALAAANAVDFDRMIVWTRDLLRDHPAVREALRRRLRVLIVDEFQDVDPLQKEIAYLLGDPASDRADTTRLMLVGDPKQSIYRFRRADVTVWREVERDFTERGHGRVVTLRENFRSVAAVLGFVDATVGRLLDQPFDGQALQPFEVGYLPVTPRTSATNVGPAVELLVVACDGDEKPSVGDIRAAEADAIAQRARELHGEGIAWSEMALLLPAWTALETYENALRRAGVPTYALRTEGFYERREVLDLILALETVRDPRDDRALLGFLRSPFVGLTDETLLEIALQLRPPYWDGLASAKVGEQALLDWAVNLIAEHAALRDRIAVDELLERLLEQSGYLGHLFALGAEARQALANVRKFVRLARQRRGHGVGDLLRAIREIRKRGDREGDARLYGEGEDVFTLTTIHSAKGLEWRVVFWADLIRRPQGGRTQGMVLGRDALALEVRDTVEVEVEEGGPHPPTPDSQSRRSSLLEHERAEELAEQIRLWYVAATRAKERLVLSGFATRGMPKGCPAQLLAELLGGVPERDGARIGYASHDGARFEARVRRVPLAAAAVVAGPEGGVATSGGASAGFVPTPIPAARPPLTAPVGRPRHSATELLVHARCARRHWFRYVAGLREPAVERAGPVWQSAIARGQIVHDVLEHLVEEEALDPVLEAAIGRWAPDAPTPETAAGGRWREALRREIEAAAGHPAYRALAGAAGARAELPFLYILGRDTVLEGKVDLAARADDGIAALDVKTGAVSEDAVRTRAAAYGLQRDAYVSALSTIGGAPVHRFAFLFSGSGIEVADALSPEARAAARTRLDQALARATEAAACPPVTAHAMECRFCGYRAVGWCEGAQGGDGEPAQ